MTLAQSLGLNFICHPSGHKVDLVRLHGLTWLLVLDSDTVLIAATTSPNRDLIHRRYGHLHEAGLLKLDSLDILGISGYSKLYPLSFCPDYATAKATIANINRRSTRDRDPPHPFHTVALNIWGPTSTPDISGDRYVLDAVCSRLLLLLPSSSSSNPTLPPPGSTSSPPSPHLATSQLGSASTTTPSS
jgi:hypothetical protein